MINRLTLIAAFAFAAMGVQTAAAQDPIPLKFAGSVTWLGQLPIMVAIDEGFFAEEGLNVSYETIVSSADRVMAVTSGAADFSNLGRSTVLAQLSRGNDSFVWFGNIDQAPGAEACYAAPGIDNVAAMKGKRVAANTSAEFTMSMLMKDNGLTRSDIQFFDLPPAEMVPALAKGDVDVACLWEPYLSKAEAAVPGGKVIGRDNDTASYKRTGTVASADLLIMSKKLISENPKAAAGVTKALFKAVDFISANPDKAAEIYAGYSKIDIASVKAGMKAFEYIPRSDFLKNIDGQMAQMTELSEWMIEQKKIRQMPDLKASLDTSFVATN